MARFQGIRRETGFQFEQHVSQEKQFVNDEAIPARYYKEVEESLKEYTGTKRILIFHHTMKQASHCQCLA